MAKSDVIQVHIYIGQLSHTDASGWNRMVHEVNSSTKTCQHAQAPYQESGEGRQDCDISRSIACDLRMLAAYISLHTGPVVVCCVGSTMPRPAELGNKMFVYRLSTYVPPTWNSPVPYRYSGCNGVLTACEGVDFPDYRAAMRAR